jgi:hypothetical protein
VNGALEELREKAQALIDKRGLRAAASDIGVNSDALARFVAGGQSHAGTVKLIEVGLRKAVRGTK